MTNFEASEYVQKTRREYEGGMLDRADLWYALNYCEREFHECVQAMLLLDCDLAIKYSQDATNYAEMCSGLRSILGTTPKIYALPY